MASAAMPQFIGPWDTQIVATAIHAGHDLRPDVAETPLTQEEALAGGPKTEAGMFVAPRILGSEE